MNNICQNFKTFKCKGYIMKLTVGVVTRIGDGRPKAFVSIPGQEKGFQCSLV